MGELKDIREQQGSLINRAKTLGNTLYLAGLGAYSKVSNGSEALYSEYLAIGGDAYGDQAEDKPKALLAGRGAIVSARKLISQAPTKQQDLYEQLVLTGKDERGEKADGTSELVLAGLGAVTALRQESQKWFNDLVRTGEKQQA